MGRAAGCSGEAHRTSKKGIGVARGWATGLGARWAVCATREGTTTLSEVPRCSGCWGVAEGPSLPWHLLDSATFVLAAGSPPARWEEGSGLRRKRAVLAVLLHFLETYKGLLQEEESAGKVIKVGVPFPCPPTQSPAVLALTSLAPQDLYLLIMKDTSLYHELEDEILKLHQLVETVELK